MLHVAVIPILHVVELPKGTDFQGRHIELDLALPFPESFPCYSLSLGIE